MLGAFCQWVDDGAFLGWLALPNRFLPDRHGSFDLFEVPLADVEGGGAVFGVDAEQEAGFFCGDVAEAMLDENAMGAVLGAPFFQQGGEGFFDHGEVGTVVDAADGATVLAAAHGAKELDLRSFLGLERGGDGANGISREQEGHGGRF